MINSSRLVLKVIKSYFFIYYLYWDQNISIRSTKRADTGRGWDTDSDTIVIVITLLEEDIRGYGIG